jgi:hypothetical protein
LLPGVTKLDTLSKFFDSVVDGTADLKGKEESVPDEPKEETFTHEEQVVVSSVPKGKAASSSENDRPKDEL